MKKLKLGYDNLEDAKVKLAGTYCLHKGKAMAVKGVSVDEEVPPGFPQKYIANGTYVYNGRGILCSIDDPEFNCSDFNIGYLNYGPVTAWYYRIPMKQWRQGLRGDQVGIKVSKPEYRDHVSFQGKPLAQMMENVYPPLELVCEELKSQNISARAFHKDVALSFDKMHSDFILEYKGNGVGFTKDFKDIKLLDEYQHLMETIREVVG